MTALWIPGRPVPCPRPRARAGQHAYYPPAYTAWLEAAAWQIRAQRPEHLEGKVEVTAAIHPNGYHVHLAGMDAQRCGRGKGVVADIDNLAKGLLDAITLGGAWDDDRQVVALHCALYPNPYDPKDPR